jgi:tetratricopeptide (TPR) repeat protein
LLRAEGKGADANELIRKYADGPDADLMAAANLLTEFEDHAAAEALVRRYVTTKAEQPESVLVLIRYLIQRKNFEEALSLCDRAWDTWGGAKPDSAVVLANEFLQALAGVPGNSRAFVRVNERLQAAMTKYPDRPEFVAALATVKNLEGRFDEAITLYRRVVEKDPKNVGALNNLAWLLALSGSKSGEALVFAERAVELSGQNPGMLDTRAVAAVASGQSIAIDRAIQDLELMATESSKATTYFHLAQAYTHMNRRRDAVIAWQRAITLGLTADLLHPLERPTFEQLRKDFN